MACAHEHRCSGRVTKVGIWVHGSWLYTAQRGSTRRTRTPELDSRDPSQKCTHARVNQHHTLAVPSRLPCPSTSAPPCACMSTHAILRGNRTGLRWRSAPQWSRPRRRRTSRRPRGRYRVNCHRRARPRVPRDAREAAAVGVHAAAARAERGVRLSARETARAGGPSPSRARPDLRSRSGCALYVVDIET